MRIPRISKLAWLGAAAVVLFFGAAHGASASTNINSASDSHWAWNDAAGWIDFYNNGTSNVTVVPSGITYSASSSVGPLSLDCATSPGGNICDPSNGNYAVTNDGAGHLGGWAWNDVIGWVTFYWGNATADPLAASSTHNAACVSYGTSTCGVYIDLSGDFHGYAWSDTVGWISFNCLDPSVCLSSSYKVNTSWIPNIGPVVGTLDSETFNTGVSTGAQLNSVIWHGTLNGLPAADVGFQFATSSSSSGPWTAFIGPDGSPSSTYYSSLGPDIPIPITNYPAFLGAQYFRYRIILTTDNAQSLSPKVTGVSVNWSP